MDTAHNDREANWNDMLERWNELSWCAYAYHETDMIAAKILLWRDATTEPALFLGREQTSSRSEQEAGTGKHKGNPGQLPDAHHAPRRRSTLPEGLRVIEVGGRAVWWTLMSAAAALGRALR